MTQVEALKIMKLGHNVFLTGQAGAGKTYVLNQYINWLKENSIPVAVTASTGIASTHIGGTTLHSFAGLGANDEIDDRLLDQILQKQNVYRKVNNISVLIIDEVSMLRSTVLDAVNIICKRIRASNKMKISITGDEVSAGTQPFGGVQVIFCGDFYQLPPVITNRELKVDDYAFSSQAWREAKPVICYITENHRQSDNSLNAILNNIRSGELDYELLETLQETIDRDLSNVNHVKLYSHNADVDAINKTYYEKINSDDEREYYMTSMGNKLMVEKLKKSCLSPELLQLKVGTKVIFTRNDKFGKYNNGSIGEVLEFKDNDAPLVRLNNGKEIEVMADSWRIEEDGKVLAQISQLPLRYAWAITIHKSQGMTLDAAEIDLSKSFGYALGYVALSRVRDIESMKLLGANANAFLIHPHIHKVDIDLRVQSQKAVSAISKYNDQEVAEKHNTFLNKNKKEIIPKVNTFEETKKLISPPPEGGVGGGGRISLEEIANIRNLTVGTIITHIETLLDDNEIKFTDIENLIPKKLKEKKILETYNKAKEKLGDEKLTPIKKYFEDKKVEITFDELKLLRIYNPHP